MVPSKGFQVSSTFRDDPYNSGGSLLIQAVKQSCGFLVRHNHIQSVDRIPGMGCILCTVCVWPH